MKGHYLGKWFISSCLWEGVKVASEVHAVNNPGRGSFHLVKYLPWNQEYFGQDTLSGCGWMNGGPVLSITNLESDDIHDVLTISYSK